MLNWLLEGKGIFFQAAFESEFINIKPAFFKKPKKKKRRGDLGEQSIFALPI